MKATILVKAVACTVTQLRTSSLMKVGRVVHNATSKVASIVETLHIVINVMEPATSTSRTVVAPIVTVPTINLSMKESASTVNLKAAINVRTSHIVLIAMKPGTCTL